MAECNNKKSRSLQSLVTLEDSNEAQFKNQVLFLKNLIKITEDRTGKAQKSHKNSLFFLKGMIYIYKKVRDSKLEMSGTGESQTTLY